MATYGYKAIDSKTGKEVKPSSIQADSIEQAKSTLKNQGLIVVDISEQGFINRDLSSFSLGKKKVKPRDLCVWSRQFVSMTKAGVSILDALRMLGEQTENPTLSAATDGIRVGVEKGGTLAGSMRDFPESFPELMVNMVEAGEASGSLDTAIDRMAVQFESTAKTQALVKKALIYPIIVCIVAVAVVVIMLVKVIPSYTMMFEELDVELPGITKAVVAASNFLMGYWFVIVPFVIVAAVGISMYSKTDSGKHVFHKIQLKIPVINNLKVKQASSMMSRTLSTLLAAGVPLVDAVEIVAKTMTNVYFKEALDYCKSEVIIGQPLSRPLEECNMFPPMVYHMTKIGEEAGDTEGMLTKLADYYDEEVEIAVQAMMAAMEPMIIIVLALIVGVLVFACIMPMLTMYEALNNL